MKVKIYNTLTRSKQEIKPIVGDTIRIYSCGLTVYDFAHIGNLRKYIFDDLLKRTLLYFGYKVKHVMNITDVGHLTSDADEGEDKIEKRAKREKKTAREIADFYQNAFIEDLKKLNIALADLMPKATDYIKEQIDLVKKLEDKGFTYRTSDGVYFDTSKDKNYGRLAGLQRQQLREGARIAKNPQKKHPSDFALWKFSPPRSSGQPRREMEWPSPWGVGFPGWHLECSAMSTELLGQPFEIHTGGVDHIGVHHVNEIAQSEAAAGKPLAKYFIHSEHLLQEGKKMAKSRGNFLRLKDLEDKGFSPLDFRFLCLQAHYQSKLDFSWRSLAAARSARKRINDFYWRSQGKGDSRFFSAAISSFEKKLADNLDTPAALEVIFTAISAAREKGVGGREAKKFIEKINQVLQVLDKKKQIPPKIIELAAERNKLRQSGDFAKADCIRREIEKAGYRIEDFEDKSEILPL